MKPSERFARIYGCVQKVSSFIGIDLYNEESQRSRRRDMMYAFIFISVCLTQLTLIDAYPDTGAILRVMFIMCPELNGVIRSFIVIRHAKLQLRSLTETLKIYNVNQIMSAERQKIVQKRIRPNELTLLFLVISYSAVMLGYPVVYLIRHFVAGSNLLFYPIELPYLEVETALGYFANFAVQIILSFTGLCSLVAFDGILLVFAGQTIMLTDLFQCNLMEIEEEMNQLKPTDVDIGRKMRKLIQRIVVEHRAYNDYVRNYLQYARPSCFVMMVFKFVTVIACMITVLTSTFYVSIGFLMVGLNQICIVCAIGTVISWQVSFRIQVKFSSFSINIFIPTEREAGSSLVELRVVQVAA